jgi:predicted amidohydrolase
MIIGPMGEVLGVASQHEDIVIAEINLSYVNTVRKQLPLLNYISTNAYRIKQ